MGGSSSSSSSAANPDLIELEKLRETMAKDRLQKVLKAEERSLDNLPEDSATSTTSRSKTLSRDEVEPYRELARCVLAIFQKCAILAQF